MQLCVAVERLSDDSVEKKIKTTQAATARSLSVLSQASPFSFSLLREIRGSIRDTIKSHPGGAIIKFFAISNLKPARQLMMQQLVNRDDERLVKDVTRPYYDNGCAYRSLNRC